MSESKQWVFKSWALWSFSLFCHLLIFFKNNFFKKLFEEYHQSVKQFGTTSRQTVHLDLGRICLQSLSADDKSYRWIENTYDKCQVSHPKANSETLNQENSDQSVHYLPRPVFQKFYKKYLAYFTQPSILSCMHGENRRSLSVQLVHNNDSDQNRWMTIQTWFTVWRKWHIYGLVSGEAEISVCTCLNMLPVTFAICWKPLQTVWIQIRPNLGTGLDPNCLILYMIGFLKDPF